MASDRFTRALETGAARLPGDGRIVVFHPPAGMVLSGLPRDRVHVVQPFRPDHDAFAAAGYAAGPAADDGASYTSAVVCLPRARAAARALIARAVRLTGGGPVVIDGQKSDGIDSLLREVRDMGEVPEVLSKAHGKTFTLLPRPSAAWSAWEQAAAPRDAGGGLSVAAGVFSADGPDPGSAALAAVLPDRLAGRVADLGAGWGYLSRAILDRPAVTEVHLVEADHDALALARAALQDDPRARFHWADATTFAAASGFDAVVTNPPFHRGAAADPGLGRAFIASAARLLAPAGALYLVANRHLPYEAALTAAFAEVAEIAEGPAARSLPYKLYRAARPRRAAPRRG
jgi:16S rRNA (guanine1207-N2)-methyltransferase